MAGKQGEGGFANGTLFLSFSYFLSSFFLLFKRWRRLLWVRSLTQGHLRLVANLVLVNNVFFFGFFFRGGGGAAGTVTRWINGCNMIALDRVVTFFFFFISFYVTCGGGGGSSYSSGTTYLNVQGAAASTMDGYVLIYPALLPTPSPTPKV